MTARGHLKSARLTDSNADKQQTDRDILYTDTERQRESETECIAEQID